MHDIAYSFPVQVVEMVSDYAFFFIPKILVIDTVLGMKLLASSAINFSWGREQSLIYLLNFLFFSNFLLNIPWETNTSHNEKNRRVSWDLLIVVE